jgi:hypothetical protein
MKVINWFIKKNYYRTVYGNGIDLLHNPVFFIQDPLSQTANKKPDNDEGN